MVSTLDFDPTYIEKARRYTISVTTGESDEEPFISRAAEFPYTAGVGPTPEESLRTLLEILASTLQVLEVSGDPLPEPFGAYSGILHLRVPRRMHQALAHQAQTDGVSLNAAATALLATALGVSPPQRGRGRPRKTMSAK
jgi:predicted RNase H-like HicB family nuclease